MHHDFIGSDPSPPEENAEIPVVLTYFSNLYSSHLQLRPPWFVEGRIQQCFYFSVFPAVWGAVSGLCFHEIIADEIQA